ncbi:hypothetical protein FA13DRAFT_1733078 [Coprinellus micaceus]|uniref:Osmotin, thaumatin-like protein n=1 Tax=Coprinellus micaceus TaxID=71717 RepID=A0A4Y7TB38_COPMI|nr:hypothetical protein FA13DRAFT_1733078 [Coprinellus micaceus]
MHLYFSIALPAAHHHCQREHNLEANPSDAVHYHQQLPDGPTTLHRRLTWSTPSPSKAARPSSVRVTSHSFNTNANGGSINSTGTLRAGFKANGAFYYFVKDPNRINTGIKVEPQHQLTDTGFCVAIICEDVGCSNSFTLPPNDQTYPPTGPIAPTPPFYQCPFSNVTYVVTFCPSGNWAT